MSTGFDPVTDNSAVVNIRWEKVRVPFTVEVDVPKVALMRARSAVEAAKVDDWRTPFNAAGYAKQVKADADAKEWAARALTAVDESIRNKGNLGNLAGKPTFFSRSAAKTRRSPPRTKPSPAERPTKPTLRPWRSVLPIQSREDVIWTFPETRKAVCQAVPSSHATVPFHFRMGHRMLLDSR